MSSQRDRGKAVTDQFKFEYECYADVLEHDARRHGWDMVWPGSRKKYALLFDRRGLIGMFFIWGISPEERWWGRLYTSLPPKRAQI